jgi:exo-beta-1,3-glucanase (GH17 family)
MKARKTLWSLLIIAGILALFAGGSMHGASALDVSEEKGGAVAPVFSDKLDGVGYGPARDGQYPSLGDLPAEEEIWEDIQFISTLAHSIRTYGITGSMEAIPSFSSEAGLDCFPGAWISKNGQQNDREIQALISVGTRGLKSVKGLVVGNETLLRQDLPEEGLVRYIKQVKDSTGQPVGTAEPWYIWLEHPHLACNVDFLFVHIYPYWEGLSIDDAAEYVFDKLQEVRQAYPGKRVIIGETGWPTGGDIIGEAVPGERNQSDFIAGFLTLNHEHDAEYFVFEVFDEKWKETIEGQVGAHWGLYYSDGALKPELGDMIPRAAQAGIRR